MIRLSIATKISDICTCSPLFIGADVFILLNTGYFKFHVSEVNPCELISNKCIMYGRFSKYEKKIAETPYLGVITVYAGLKIPVYGE